MNSFFKEYKDQCEQLEVFFAEYGESASNAKKLRGAICAEMLRNRLIQHIQFNNIPVKISPVNSYILGSKYEYDLLVVKADAKPVCKICYRPEDVISVIESKAGGLMDVRNETFNISEAANSAWKLNNSLKFGYFTIGENVPKKEFHSDGRETVNHWKLTNTLFSELLHPNYIIYSVTIHQGKNVIDEGNDEDFSTFLSFITKPVSSN